MIATDSSTLIAFLHDVRAPDTEQLRAALVDHSLVMPPPVITEILSARGITRGLEIFLQDVQRMPIMAGLWERAGHNRAMLLRKGLKAKLADALIAQCCIDGETPLITRDADYRHFAKWCGLKLAT